MNSIIVTHIKTGKKFKEYTYDDLLSAELYKSDLDKIYNNKKDYSISCSCSTKPLMHFRKLTHRYSISANPKSKVKHDEECLFRGDLKESQLRGIHFQALQIVAPDHIKVTINHLGIVEATRKKRLTSANNSNRNSISSSKMTIGSFGRELLSRSWEYAMDNFISGKHPYPTVKGIRFALKELFVGGYPNTQPKLKVEISKGEFLNNKLLLGFEKMEVIYHKNKENINPVIMLPFNKEMLQKDFDENHHLLRFPSVNNNQATNEYKELVIGKDEWEEITSTYRTRVNFNNHEQYFIIGLGEANEYGKPPILFKAELIPTTKRGMFVDSSFENEFFTILERKQRDYIKPNQLLEQLDNLKPDAILRDSEKPCIIEIFGMSEANKDYHEARYKKINYYESLRDFQFYKWDAFKGEKPKPLPNKKINKN